MLGKACKLKIRFFRENRWGNPEVAVIVGYLVEGPS